MRIKQAGEYNGLLLGEEYSFDSELVVLTGQNGSGKTRFFEAVQKKLIAIEIENSPVDASDEI